ncbi:hypothetical protein ACG02S_01165 [Roseateles sp. DC23W]|uniref:Uncharacterized protein n=1 Tax=Pelomonas dachongensis TaxID=3299029 RepID=A0ABW7EKE6_9BURK
MKPAWHSLTTTRLPGYPATRVRLRLGARQVLNCRLTDIAGCELLQQAPDTRSQAAPPPAARCG